MFSPARWSGRARLTRRSADSNRCACHLICTSPGPGRKRRMKLAELYRKTGRVSQAEKVEDELRRYLSAADPDHPLLAQLSTGRAHPSR